MTVIKQREREKKELFVNIFIQNLEKNTQIIFTFSLYNSIFIFFFSLYNYTCISYFFLISK